MSTTPRTYYRPTPGGMIGTWNVFPRNGGVTHDVPFEDLPTEVRDDIVARLEVLS